MSDGFPLGGGLPSRATVCDALDVRSLPRGTMTKLFVELVADGLGNGIRVPVMVARGSRDGPIVGITAAVHGNELNGVAVIHEAFAKLDPDSVRGTVVGVPVVNVPGLHRHQREFIDGTDLNRSFPGREDGTVAQVYVHRLLTRVVQDFEILLDLHTASFGRINSLYVRADMTNPDSARMAYLLRPAIVVHNPARDGSLRGEFTEAGVPAITVEIGDPSRWQGAHVRETLAGIRAVMADLGVLRRGKPRAPGPDPVICDRSYWMYTDRGGLLEVLPDLEEVVRKDQPVARVRDAFGHAYREYRAPEDGVVVGKSVNPVGQTGARILHLGVPARPAVEGATHPFVARAHGTMTS